jgi:hypothetical protein
MGLILLQQVWTTVAAEALAAKAGFDDVPEARSTLGFRLGGQLLDVGGSATASGFWSIENIFELAEGVRDIGGSWFFRSVAFLLVKILPGPKDIGVDLLILPN